MSTEMDHSADALRDNAGPKRKRSATVRTFYVPGRRSGKRLTMKILAAEEADWHEAEPLMLTEGERQNEGE